MSDNVYALLDNQNRPVLKTLVGETLIADLQDNVGWRVGVYHDNELMVTLSSAKDLKEFLGDFYDTETYKYLSEQVGNKDPKSPKKKNMTMSESLNRSAEEEQECDQPFVMPENEWKSLQAIDPVKDAINPSHYQNVAAGRQYMELMVDILSRFEGVQAHLMGQIYKYLMRAGLKDNIVQDLNKAKWYLDALVKYEETGYVI